MVGLFVRLKLRLLRNGLRMGRAYVVGFWLITTFGVLGALLAAVALAAAANSAAVVLFSAMLLGWLVLPIVLSAADESLEPSRLLVFPLRGRDTMLGLFAAAFVGIGPLVSAIALAGAVIASASVVGLLGAVLQLMLCVTASRALTTSLSAVLRSRRGRDLAAGAVVLVGLLPLGLNVLARKLLRGTAPTDATVRLAGVLRWTPPGMAARAPADAAAGRYGAAALELLVVAACIAILLLVWSKAVARIVISHDASSSSVRAGGGLLTWVGDRGRAGAVAARDLRYQWRDPRRRVLWVQVVVLLIFVLGPAARASGGLMVAGVAFTASVLAMQAAQQFGYDGAAFWLHVSATGTRADVRSDLLGKAVASSAVTLPLLVTATVIGAAISGRLPILATAVVVEVSAFGVGLASSTLLSVWFPVPLPDSSRNVFGSVDPGRGCLAGLAGLGMTMLGLAIVLAAAIPLLRFVHGPPAVALSAGMLALALAAGIAARAAAARIAFAKLPELLAAVTPRGG